MQCPRCGNLKTSNTCGWCGYEYEPKVLKRKKGEPTVIEWRGRIYTRSHGIQYGGRKKNENK